MDQHTPQPDEPQRMPPAREPASPAESTQPVDIARAETVQVAPPVAPNTPPSQPPSANPPSANPPSAAPTPPSRARGLLAAGSVVLLMLALGGTVAALLDPVAVRWAQQQARRLIGHASTPALTSAYHPPTPTPTP
ncbi:MAG TPA: hypothetical protein VFY89_08070, partial [Ktedonobacterales bacterium]